MTSYSKMLAMVAATVAAAAVAALSDNTITTKEWINLAVAGVGAAAVFAGPNVPGARYTKAVLAALSAGLMALLSTIDGGLTTSAFLQVAIAVAGALGVYAVPNSQPASAQVPGTQLS